MLINSDLLHFYDIYSLRKNCFLSQLPSVALHLGLFFSSRQITVTL